MMKEFPRLPVLDNIVRFGKRLDIKFDDLVVIGVQHLLSTTGSLVAGLLELGFRREHIFLLGKGYSSCSEVEVALRKHGIFASSPQENLVPGYFARFHAEAVRRQWDVFLAQIDKLNPRGIIVIDDGGACIRDLPQELLRRLPIIGVEQTTSGLGIFQNAVAIPVVEVASSAAKTILEPDLIASAIETKISSILPLNLVQAIGVVGLGNIGSAVVRAMNTLGVKVGGYDKRLKDDKMDLAPAVRTDSLQTLFEHSELILGCTGTDITSDITVYANLRGQRTLASCSSSDIEFQTLLRSASSSEVGDPFRSIDISLGKSEWHILRGGFPVNFDRSPTSVPATDIQLTRALMCAGIIQAAILICQGFMGSGGLMLESSLQRRVVELWNTEQGRRLNTPSGFTELHWIEQRSGGRRSDIGSTVDSFL